MSKENPTLSLTAAASVSKVNSMKQNLKNLLEQLKDLH